MAFLSTTPLIIQPTKAASKSEGMMAHRPLKTAHLSCQN